MQRKVPRFFLALFTGFLLAVICWFNTYPTWDEMYCVKQTIEKYCNQNPDDMIASQIESVVVKPDEGRETYYVIVNLANEPSREYIKEFKARISDSVWIRFRKTPESGYIMLKASIHPNIVLK